MWTVTVSLDDDKPNVGVATAIWNKGLEDEFTFSARGGADQISEFVAGAEQERDIFLARRTSERAFAAQIAGALNGSH